MAALWTITGPTSVQQLSNTMGWLPRSALLARENADGSQSAFVAPDAEAKPTYEPYTCNVLIVGLPKTRLMGPIFIVCDAQTFWLQLQDSGRVFKEHKAVGLSIVNPGGVEQRHLMPAPVLDALLGSADGAALAKTVLDAAVTHFRVAVLEGERRPLPKATPVASATSVRNVHDQFGWLAPTAVCCSAPLDRMVAAVDETQDVSPTYVPGIKTVLFCQDERHRLLVIDGGLLADIQQSMLPIDWAVVHGLLVVDSNLTQRYYFQNNPNDQPTIDASLAAMLVHFREMARLGPTLKSHVSLELGELAIEVVGHLRASKRASVTVATADQRRLHAAAVHDADSLWADKVRAAYTMSLVRTHDIPLSGKLMSALFAAQDSVAANVFSGALPVSLAGTAAVHLLSIEEEIARLPCVINAARVWRAAELVQGVQVGSDFPYHGHATDLGCARLSDPLPGYVSSSAALLRDPLTMLVRHVSGEEFFSAYTSVANAILSFLKDCPRGGASLTSLSTAPAQEAFDALIAGQNALAEVACAAINTVRPLLRNARGRDSDIDVLLKAYAWKFELLLKIERLIATPLDGKVFNNGDRIGWCKAALDALDHWPPGSISPDFFVAAAPKAVRLLKSAPHTLSP